MLKELEIISWLQQRVASSGGNVLVGIGDDAAVLRCGGELLLVTTDMIIGGTHFVPETPPELVGRKAVAVNLSDIAAMGGLPVAAFLSFALPRIAPDGVATRLLEGAVRLCEEFECPLAGGDTNGTDGPLCVSVTIVGRPGAAGPILRSGASAGDIVFVTGWLGGSLAGKHLEFIPRVREALFLADHGPPGALIDVSDGLALDCYRVARASRCTIVLDADRIPIAPEVQHTDLRLRLHSALYDGEDFELLGCIRPERWDVVCQRWPFDVPLRQIGYVEEGEGDVILRTADGSREPVQPSGFDHFKRGA